MPSAETTFGIVYLILLGIWLFWILICGKELKSKTVCRSPITAPPNLRREQGFVGVALDFGYMADLVIPWQARFLRGLRRPDVRTAALSVARSNGKSWLAARLAADYLRDGAPLDGRTPWLACLSKGW